MKKAAFVLAIFTAASYVLGFARDLALAHFFGAGAAVDAFWAAFLPGDFIFNFLAAGALSGVLMPAFLRAEKNSKIEAEKFLSTFLTFLNLAVLLFSAVAFVGADFIAKNLLAAGQSEILVAKLIRINLIAPVFFAASNSLSSILLSREIFWPTAIAPLFYNLGILIGIFFGAQKFGISAAAVGAAIGAVLHFVARFFPFLKLKIKVRPRFSPDENFFRVLKLSIPRTVGFAAFQLVLVIFARVSFSISAGVFAAFSFARNVQSAAISFFAIAISTAIFPVLSKNFAQKN